MRATSWLNDWFTNRTGLPEISHETNVFDSAWIDSLGVMELVDDLEKAFGFRFESVHFQDRRFPTIAGLASIVEEILGPSESGAVQETMSTDWAAYYGRIQGSSKDLTYPSETLVRLLRGDYLQGTKPDLQGRRILDVGFGSGNNTAFLCTLGMEVHGVEIHPDICATVSDSLRRGGLSADLRVGANTSLPYPDDHFDFLVSWNVIHYEGEEERILAAIREFARVLKPGGHLLLSTTGPRHRILVGATPLGDHRYRIGEGGEFREGQVHWFFDDAEAALARFSTAFGKVRVGRTLSELFHHDLDWWIVTGTKGSD